MPLLVVKNLRSRCFQKCQFHLLAACRIWGLRTTPRDGPHSGDFTLRGADLGHILS